MRLQAMRIPNALHRRGAHILSPRHGAHAPMRGGRRFAMQSCLHDLLNPRGRNRRLASPPGRIFGERRRSTFLETPAPQNHARPTGSQFLSNLAVGLALRSQQHNAHTEGDLLRRVARRHPTGQCASLLLGQLQRFRHGPHHTWTMTHFSSYVKLFMRHYTSSFANLRPASLRYRTFWHREACRAVRSRRRLIRFTAAVEGHRNGPAESSTTSRTSRDSRAQRDLGATPFKHSNVDPGSVLEPVPLDKGATTCLSFPLLSSESATAGFARCVICGHHCARASARSSLPYRESGGESGNLDASGLVLATFLRSPLVGIFSAPLSRRIPTSGSFPLVRKELRYFGRILDPYVAVLIAVAAAYSEYVAAWM